MLSLKKILPLTLLLWVFIFSGCSLSQPTDQVDDQPLIVNNEKQEQQYQDQLVAILEPYWLSGEFLGLKEQILDLRAPAKFLDLHLNLVLALQDLETGTGASDQTKIDLAKNNIKELIESYNWLKVSNNNGQN